MEIYILFFQKSRTFTCEMGTFQNKSSSLLVKLNTQLVKIGIKYDIKDILTKQNEDMSFFKCEAKREKKSSNTMLVHVLNYKVVWLVL